MATNLKLHVMAGHIDAESVLLLDLTGTLTVFIGHLATIKVLKYCDEY